MKSTNTIKHNVHPSGIPWESRRTTAPWAGRGLKYSEIDVCPVCKQTVSSNPKKRILDRDGSVYHSGCRP